MGRRLGKSESERRGATIWIFVPAFDLTLPLRIARSASDSFMFHLPKRNATQPLAHASGYQLCPSSPTLPLAPSPTLS